MAVEEEKITKVPSLSDRKDVSAFRKGRRYKRNHEFVGKDYEFNFGYTSLKANMSLNLKIGTSLKMLHQDCFSAAINFLKGCNQLKHSRPYSAANINKELVL